MLPEDADAATASSKPVLPHHPCSKPRTIWTLVMRSGLSKHYLRISASSHEREVDAECEGN